MPSTTIVKHSVKVDGRETSISLEGPFWSALKDIANERGEKLSATVARFAATHKQGPRSSHLRVCILEHYLPAAAQAAGQSDVSHGSP
jgi:predicted DNA-binding ribbon-helix-helix protein